MRASRIAALCSEDGVYSTLTSELASRFADAALTVRLQLPVAAASRALRRGDTMEALTLLNPVRPYDHAPAAEFWPAYLRGHAYLQARDGGAARAEFQRILDHRGEAPTSPLYALATLGLARAALLEGNTAASKTALASFGTAWNDADPDLPPRDARWRLFDQAAAAAPR